MKKLNRALLLFVILLMAGAVGVSRLRPESGRELLADPVTWLAGAAIVFLLIAFLATYQALEAMKHLIAQKEGRLPVNEDEEATETEEEDSWVSGIMQKLTDSTPVEEEDKVATDHEYDGIRELDNNLPPWWLAGFYLSIIFAVVYLLRYHVFQTAPLQEEELRIEMAEAEKEKEAYLESAANLVNESNVEMVESEDRIQSGKAIFGKNCVQCHAQDGGGGVGPNLTDKHWIHGNTISDIFGVIKRGVPDKGMVPWEDKLSPAEIQEIASYIITLQGKEPADPKEPQGEKLGYAVAGNDKEASADTTESTEP